MTGRLKMHNTYEKEVPIPKVTRNGTLRAKGLMAPLELHSLEEAIAIAGIKDGGGLPSSKKR